MQYILAIDQSTAGTKGIVTSADGVIVARCDLPHRQITNEQGWIEHDPVEILKNTLAVSHMAVEKAGIEPQMLKAVGISNQRETIVCWDRETGAPVYNAIVWQCGRAAQITDRMAQHADYVRKTTGLQLSPFFSAPKFAWILENVPEASKLASEGRLCCGNIDAWLVFSLTNERAFKTDYSNASRTQLLNLDTLKWDEKLCSLFGLSPEMLPEICFSDSLFGHTDLGGLLKHPIPICAVLGDSHAALYANGCFREGEAKATFGTGTSVMMNAGSKRPQTTTTGVVESLAWGVNGEVDYVLEGNINYSGAIVKWLVDHLQLLDSSAQSEPVAASVPDNGGVYLVPAFSGLGAPYWRNDVHAMICGMNASTTRAHIVRAGLEAIAYQISDIAAEMDRNSGAHLDCLCVDGGATHNRLLMQFVADMTDARILISDVEELSAAGVAYLASIRSGCATQEEIFAKAKHQALCPTMNTETRQKNLRGWHEAVAMLLQH